MKLFAEHGTERHEVEIKIKDKKVFAAVDNRRYELESREVEPNTFLFNLNGQVFECYVAPQNAAGVTRVRQKTKSYDFKLSDPKRLRGAGETAGQAAGTAQIVSQMPGKIVRVLVEAGVAVKAGESIIVVEAMKMQNEMKSPKDGVVKELRAEIGVTVNAGDILAVIE